MLPFLVDDLELEKDFVVPPLNLDYVPVERILDGVRVKVLEPRLVDSTSLMKFSARDFQLQEILESGSYDLLTSVRPISINPLSAYDSAEKSSRELDNYLDRLSKSVDVESNNVE